jgi:tetratricopeptide (TPR) repeat protein
LIAKDEFESAIRNYDRVLELKSNDIESWIAKAEAYMTLGRFEGAIGGYDRAIDLDKNNKSHWMNKGMLLDRTGKYEDAIAAFNSALDLDEKDANIWHRKGLSISKLGDMEGAIGCYDRALGLAPKNKQIWTSKGVAMNNVGNYEQALRCFEHALEIDSKFMPAQEGKERADREIKKGNLMRYSKAILRFEKEYRRPATKEEAFRVCHIPYSYLDSVIEFLKKREDVDINLLTPEEKNKFEQDSNRTIVMALHDDPASFEEHGLRLSDIVMGFPDYDIVKAKRLLAYINKADEMDMKVDEVDPDLEELLHRALELPRDRRNVNGLIMDMNLGIFEAKRVYAVLVAFHDQEVYTPEVRVKSLGGDYYPEEGEASYAKPELEPLDYEPEAEEEVEEEELLCTICEKNPMDIEHECGIRLCKSCLREYNDRYAKLHETSGDEIVCPKCGQEIAVRRKKGKKGEDYIRL